MLGSHGYRIIEYATESNRVPFREWLAGLDIRTRARIQARVFRFESGNLGDTKPVGAGLFEARLDFGPEYRIYMGIAAGRLIILLGGGDKRSQRRDIAATKKMWAGWKEANSHDKKKP